MDNPVTLPFAALLAIAFVLSFLVFLATASYYEWLINRMEARLFSLDDHCESLNRNGLLD